MARDATAVAAASSRVAAAPARSGEAAHAVATPAAACGERAARRTTPTAEERDSTAKSIAKTISDAESKPVAIAKPPARSSGTDLTIPLLLLFAAVSGFLAVRAAVRSQRS